MHHKSVLLPSGEILMYGGRTSPGKANSSFFLYSVCADKIMIKKLHMSSTIPARWRHTLTHLSVNGMLLLDIL